MATHRFIPKQFHNTIGSHAPVLSVGDGDTVVTESLDAHGWQVLLPRLPADLPAADWRWRSSVEALGAGLIR